MTAVLDTIESKPLVQKRVYAPQVESAEKIILRGVSWVTYENLLEDLMDNSSVRLSYNEGNLEIMTESFNHGKFTRILGQIVVFVADLFEIDFVAGGSTTFRKEKTRKGFEGDDSFYFENARFVRDKEEIDLTTDPPPELVVEIDLTHPSLPKFPIFADIGVKEIWRFDGDEVKFYRLENNDYIEVTESVCLPDIKSETVTELLFAAREMKRSDWLKLAYEKINGGEN